MNSYFSYCLNFIFLFLGVNQVLIGQINSGSHGVSISIPEVAVLDIEPNNAPIQFNFDPPTEGGNPLTLSAETQTKWINYTCAMGNNSSARSIYMQLADEDLPDGISLGLSVGNASGGSGQLGTSTGSTLLSQQPRMIISGIGRSFTGNGANAGHAIEYTLSINDYAKLKALSGTSIKIMVTITD